MKRTFYLIILLFSISLSIEADEIPQDTSKINLLEYPSSLEELTSLFKGKVIYIDLMASWCKPCIVELQESKKIEHFFKENDIIKIYVSIDQKQDIEKCIDILNQNSANGYFVAYLPSKDKESTFASEIEKLFLQDEDGSMSVSIPKYAIINKQGIIVEKRAERPSNCEALKTQLQKYID